MTHLKPTIFVRPMPALSTLMITIRGDSYGSLEAKKLAQLRTDLASIRELPPATRQRVIVDLSGVAILGSAFLRELYRWIALLELSPSNVTFCGDQTGVLQVCGTDLWLNVLPDLNAAIEATRAPHGEPQLVSQN